MFVDVASVITAIQLLHLGMYTKMWDLMSSAVLHVSLSVLEPSHVASPFANSFQFAYHRASLDAVLVNVNNVDIMVSYWLTWTMKICASSGFDSVPFVILLVVKRHYLRVRHKLPLVALQVLNFCCNWCSSCHEVWAGKHWKACGVTCLCWSKSVTDALCFFKSSQHVTTYEKLTIQLAAENKVDKHRLSFQPLMTANKMKTITNSPRSCLYFQNLLKENIHTVSLWWAHVGGLNTHTFCLLCRLQMRLLWGLLMYWGDHCRW